MRRTALWLVASCILAACGAKSEEGLCASYCDQECTQQELSPIGLDDMTSAGTIRERLEQAGVDLNGAVNLHMGELHWRGGGDLGLIEVSPDQGMTTFEAGLSYTGGQAYVDRSTCGDPGEELYVDVALTLRTADGALAETWPVRAEAFSGSTGVRVRHDIDPADFSGSFTAIARDPSFPILVTTISANFPEVGRHDGQIEIAPTAEETMEPDGSIMGGGAAPAVVASWSTEPGSGATTGDPAPTGCGALASDQECMDAGCVWLYAMDRCVEPEDTGTTGG